MSGVLRSDGAVLRATTFWEFPIRTLYREFPESRALCSPQSPRRHAVDRGLGSGSELQELAAGAVDLETLIPAQPAPSARRACSPPALNSWACPRKRRNGRISLQIRHAVMPSAAWWTRRRLRSSRPSWPRKRRGRSPASWLWQAAAPGGRYITEQTKQAESRVSSGEIWHGQGAQQRDDEAWCVLSPDRE